jgi:alanine racemase
VYAGSRTTAVTVRAIEEMNLIATITSHDQAAAYSACASRPISVYVKVDVGLERLGLQSDDAGRSIQAMSRMPNLQIDGLYAHMHWPAAGSSAYLDWQFARFKRVLDELRELNIDVAVRFVASSAVLVASTEMMLNAIDPGHLIYGLLPSGPQSMKLEVRPAFVSLKSELIHVRAVRRVEFADLAPFAVGDVTRLGVIPIGSADGMSTVNCGQVLVRGRRAPILASPSLEHTRIDLTQVPDARPGDEVVIVGRQNGAEISHDEVRHHQKFASQAALALQVSGSVQRLYTRGH